MDRLLFHSNSPLAPTGYGQQTALFAPRLAERYELAISAFYGLEGSRIRWEGIPVLPGLGGEFGNDYLLEHAQRWFKGGARDGLVLTLMDVWVLNPLLMAQMNTAAWVPVDHDPVPPKVAEWFLASSAIPLAMSRFGEERLEPFDPLYLPHAVDAAVYKPYDRAATRKKIGVDRDVFLVGMVAANKGRPSRKGFQQALEAFAAFHERHEEARLYLHTMLNPKWMGGEDLPALIDNLGLDEDSILTADQYRMTFDPYPQTQMAQIYSSLDVFLNPASGEGFGVPILEAAACGVPSICTDFSAMPEVAGPAGLLVSGTRWWTGHNSWMMIPEVEGLVAALEEVYALSSKERATVGKACRAHAEGYAVEKVWEEHFVPALDEVEERLGSIPEAVAP